MHSIFADAVGDGTDLRAHGLAAYERGEQAVRALAALATPPPAARGRRRPRRPRRCAARPATSRRARCCSRPASPTATAARRATPTRPSRSPTSSALYPVTLKAVDARLVHKSDAGGVRVGLRRRRRAARGGARDDASASRRSCSSSSARPTCATASSSWSARRRDPRFGAVVLVGLGGILVETLRDTALALAPLDAAAAERLLRSLRAAAVLDGVRGRPAVDVAAAARAVVALGDAMAAHPEIAELEVNPLLVTPRGAVALDARVALSHASKPDRMRSPWTCA